MFSLSLNLPEYLKKPLTFSSGELAKQANGSVVVSLGDTVVLVSACMSQSAREGVGFLPLFVDYQERTYAMGKIPGGFIKREGRPKDAEILTSRLIDRPIRPLFPKGLCHELQVIASVLSSDGENEPDVLAINGASCALLISDIPFAGPIAAVRISKVEDTLIVNPTYEERAHQEFETVVVGTDKKIVMIEGEYLESNENKIQDAIARAHVVIKEIIKLQLQIKEKIGKAKREVALSSSDDALYALCEKKISKRLKELYGLDKEERSVAFSEMAEAVKLEVTDEEINESMIVETLYEIEKKFVRKTILEEGLRPDKRGVDEIRKLECKVGILPRTHGSALFTRGQTQALSVITLGTSSDEQTVESLSGKYAKHFMLHYSFPPFSVGEVKPMRGPSRRDIGHGALAEKSLFNVIPDKETFPYTIRIVSEVLESNGSSSMATVCAGSLSLMDAGVPIKEPVAGIAIGIVTEGDRYKILTDIAGLEDHYGDMDFKVAGTKNGVTAIQLDVKNDGLTFEQIKEALTKAKKARETILATMNKTIQSSRATVSQYAPKIETIPIELDKIGELIGPGGKNIRRLTREYEVQIDIDDELGKVFIVTQDAEKLKACVKEIQLSLKEVEVGDIYDAKVVKIANFGAFCQLAPGKSGLLHISEISNEYVKEVRDVIKEGDQVKVKVVSIDNQGRINLSKKQVE